MYYVLYFGHGVVASPYTALTAVCNYVAPWFAPSLTFTADKNPPADKEIELIGRSLDNTAEEPKKCTSLIPYHPHLSINVPTLGEIGARALTATIIDLPVYTVKSLYASPVPTMIALYAVLPYPVWQIVGPRLLYLLPKLL